VEGEELLLSVTTVAAPAYPVQASLSCCFAQPQAVEVQAPTQQEEAEGPRQQVVARRHWGVVEAPTRQVVVEAPTLLEGAVRQHRVVEAEEPRRTAARVLVVVVVPWTAQETCCLQVLLLRHLHPVHYCH
jgi:hypothetical protein